MQPVDRSATMPAPLLPPLPGSNDAEGPGAAPPKAKSTRANAVRAAKARITRRNSLRKQRQAQKGWCRPKPSVPASVSEVAFPIQFAKVWKPVHRQAVLVFFTLDVELHQVSWKTLAGAFHLGTVCQGAVYAQRAING
jgi:hypothetical protein